MDGGEAVRALLEANADRDVIVINHRVSRDLHFKLSRTLQANAVNESCTVFLTTRGGDPNGGYRVARCLRHYYKHVRLVVPSRCKSAGTLIAIAANEVAIGDLGELGPLDIQVKKGSELEENSSGLDIQQALQAVTTHAQDAFYRLMLSTREFGLSTKLCAEFAATVTSGIVHPLMSQIDPLRVGEMQRATRVALEYGERLNTYARNLKQNALERLIGAYPAHGFVIDRKEAGELFTKVGHPTKEEQDLTDAFWEFISGEEFSEVIFLKIPLPADRDEHGDANGANEGPEGQTPSEEQGAELRAGVGELLAYSAASVG
ncbi:SDH family Clp fold serine proteinase [Stenotrophomonas maltophilia]|uniref:SDH family Clp fold serine proteinase n=1 Tax=Stenotrophomonas maltophilia TaxID=40324 RepID=UPI0039C484A1